MLARTFTATMLGLQPIKIEVEVDSNRGTPGLIIIGLPTKAVDEAKERISAALTNCGIRIRSRRTIVNLAPADIKKTSSCFELAIAIGLLKMYGEIENFTDDTMFFGELSLDGDLKPIRGALPLVLAARDMGFKQVVMPAANISEVETISGLRIYPIKHVREYLAFSRGEASLKQLPTQPFSAHQPREFETDFKHIYGQAQAKRALEIAAAGGHNVLLTGPPGAGKSLLAKSLLSILPPLSESEALEVTKIYSVCGLAEHGLITTRPFRAPHHTTSQGGLMGGSQQLKPGEISLAHRGILFLDELPEFNRDTLEALRQPLEDGKITISRATGSVTYPAAFSLIAAANPCPCGYFGSRKKNCRCQPGELNSYTKRLSGPILDRIDLRLLVTEVEAEHLPSARSQLSPNPVKRLVTSTEVRERVQAAHQLQKQRYQATNLSNNAELTSKNIHFFCQIQPEAQLFLNQAVSKYSLSARSYFNVIKVSQTIADLEGERQIAQHHVGEALLYRG